MEKSISSSNTVMISNKLISAIEMNGTNINNLNSLSKTLSNARGVY